MDSFAVVVADTDGVVRRWDTVAEKLFGHPADAVVGRTLDVLVPEAYREAHWAAFRALMAGGGADEPSDRGAVVLPVTCRDGSRRPAAVRLMLLRDAWNRPVGAAAVLAPPDAAPANAEPLPEL
jgi:PAS domain S-box-containing protein